MDSALSAESIEKLEIIRSGWEPLIESSYSSDSQLLTKYRLESCPEVRCLRNDLHEPSMLDHHIHLWLLNYRFFWRDMSGGAKISSMKGQTS